MLRIATTLIVALALAACSSLAPAPSRQAATIDPAGLDFATTLVVIDLPSALQPIPGQSKLVYTGRDGTTSASAALSPSERDFDPEALPPPPTGHAYYLLALEDAGSKEVADAQAASAGLGNVTLDPVFCRTAPVDVARTSLTAWLLPAGQGAIPFISASNISRFFAQNAALNVPECAL